MRKTEEEPWRRKVHAAGAGPAPLQFINKACLALALTAALILPAQADTLVTTDGQKREGKVISTDGKSVKFEAKIGSGRATLAFPLDKVKSLSFSNSAKEEALLRSSDPGDLKALAALWNLRKPFVAIPGADIGRVGRALIVVLLAQEKEADAEQAIKLAEFLEQQDPGENAKAVYSGYRLKALLQLGRTEEAIRMADSMAEATTGALENITQAKFFAAQAAVGKMQALEAEYPRWFEMPEIMAERRELYNDALDSFLYPVVFTPEYDEDVARGLWRAAELYAEVGYPGEARKCLDEIIEYYPIPEYLSQAQQLVKKLKTPVTTPKESS